jgi:hypothetical protein
VIPAGSLAFFPFARSDNGIPQMGHFGTSPLVKHVRPSIHIAQQGAAEAV